MWHHDMEIDIIWQFWWLQVTLISYLFQNAQPRLMGVEIEPPWPQDGWRRGGGSRQGGNIFLKLFVNNYSDNYCLFNPGRRGTCPSSSNRQHWQSEPPMSLLLLSSPSSYPSPVLIIIITNIIIIINKVTMSSFIFFIATQVKQIDDHDDDLAKWPQRRVAWPQCRSALSTITDVLTTL